MKRLYTVSNYSKVSSHYLVTASALAIVAAGYPFWAIASSLALTGIVYGVSINKSRDLFENHLVPHEKFNKHAPRLSQTLQELEQTSGIHVKKLYDFDVDHESYAQANPGASHDYIYQLKKHFRKLAQVPNAGAIYLGKPVVIVSKKLLELLNDDEEKAVIAHEFAHIHARHHYTTLPAKAAFTVAATTAVLTNLGVFFSAGFTPVIATVAAGTLSGVAYNRFKKLNHLVSKDEDELTVRQKAARKEHEFWRTGISSATAASAMTWFNPAYMSYFLYSRGIKLTSQLVNAGLSQHNEFQADRGAVMFGANPLALITALRKLTVLLKQSKEEASGGVWIEPSKMRRAWLKAVATHPTPEARIARLAKMAHEQGYSDHDIAKAVKGPINVPKKLNIPYDVVKMMVRAV